MPGTGLGDTPAAHRYHGGILHFPTTTLEQGPVDLLTPPVAPLRRTRTVGIVFRKAGSAFGRVSRLSLLVWGRLSTSGLGPDAGVRPVVPRTASHFCMGATAPY